MSRIEMQAYELAIRFFKAYIDSANKKTIAIQVKNFEVESVINKKSEEGFRYIDSIPAGDDWITLVFEGGSI